MELLDRLIRFATIRPRTEFEIKRWFARKKVSEKDAEIAIRELKNSGLVDDEAFCKWWVEQRVTFRPKSQRMLVVELARHGVNKQLAQSVVSESDLSDEAMAFQLVEKKKRVWERLTPEERKKKVITFLQIRGFNWEVIKKVISGY